MISSLFKLAAKAMSSPVTNGRLLAVSAAPVAAYTGLKVAEHETGGALSEQVFDTSVNYLKEKIKEGISIKEVENTIDSLDYITQINGAFKKGAQNLAVREIMQQNESSDAIKKGKITAISFQLLPDNMLMLSAKQSVRTAVADDMFKGDRNAADKYLANALVDDIVKNAQVRALDGHHVDRNDVHAALNEIVKNPDKHPVANKFFSDRGRLMNGLQQIWPDLAPEAAPAQRPAIAVPVTEKPKEGLSLRDSFSAASNGEGGVLQMIVMFLALLLESMGLGKGLSASFSEKASPNQPQAPQPAQDNDKPVPRMAPAALAPRPGF